MQVQLAGEVVADTVRARMLFETDLPTRFYIPRDDVRTDLLEPSPTRSACPYKGEAVYWSARVGDTVIEDVVWCYPEPVADCPHIADLMCFFNEVVDDIRVDGVEVPKTRTAWSRD